MNRAVTIAKEPSSWAGAAAIVQGIVMILPQHAALLNLASMLFGGIAVAMKDNGTKIIERQSNDESRASS